MKMIDENAKITALRRTVIYLLSAAVLLCGIAVKMYLSEKQAEKSANLLAESEYRSSLEGLTEALDSGEMHLSYHMARTASEKAALAGESELSVFLGTSAERIASGEDMREIKEELFFYLENGGSAELSQAEEESGEEEIGAVTAYRAEEADRCIQRIFGEHNSLKRERMTGNGRIVYSCTNAYASLDARTGMPLEVVISLDGCEAVLGEEECVRLALAFAEDFYPKDSGALPRVLHAEENGTAGTYDFEIDSGGCEISVSVRRDSGRISRILLR